MDVRKLLEEVKRGDTSIEEAENAFKNLPYEEGMRSWICTGNCVRDSQRRCSAKESRMPIWRIFSRRCTGKMGKYSERGRRQSSGI